MEGKNGGPAGLAEVVAEVVAGGDVPDAAAAALATSAPAGSETSAPPAMISESRAASSAPILRTSGRRTRLGTKKHASHLEMTAHPGLAALKIRSAVAGLAS